MGGPPLHIALFLAGLSGGGAQRRMLTLARGFAERGYRVDVVVARSEGPFRRELSPLVRLVPLDPAVSYLPVIRRAKGLWVMTARRALARYLGRERPDVLLSSSNPANLTALWARESAGVATPVVLTVNVSLAEATGPKRGWFRNVMRGLIRRYYPQADAVIAISDGVRRDVIDIAGVPADRVVTVYNPVDLTRIEELAAAPLDHPWVAAGAPPLLVAVGKLKRQKDFPTLLRAFERVRAVRPVRLAIFGEGDQRAKLEAWIDEHMLRREVFMPGFVENPYTWVARAAVFVLSSQWEGASNALLEALACGCRIVSTDCPSGPRELLVDGRFGRLVAVGDDRALADAIVLALNEPSAPARIKSRAAEFSVAKSVDGYLEVLLATARRERLPRRDEAEQVQPSVGEDRVGH